LGSELVSKRLGLVHDTIPAANTIALLVDSSFPGAEAQSRDMQEAARALGLQIHIVKAGTEGEIDAAFTAFAQLRAGALLVGTSELFSRRAQQLATLATRHAVPVIYQYREFVAEGDLMSYGEPHRCLSPSRCLHWSDSQGRKTSGPARFAADQVRASDQPQGRQGSVSRSRRACSRLPTR